MDVKLVMAGAASIPKVPRADAAWIRISASPGLTNSIRSGKTLMPADGAAFRITMLFGISSRKTPGPRNADAGSSSRKDSRSTP